MTNRQLKEMMRDISPRYQQRADARAAAAKPAKRRAWLPAAIGTAAVCCAGIAAVVILPRLHHDELLSPESAVQDIQEITDSTENTDSSAPDSQAAAEILEFKDIGNAVIRLVAPAFAPCAYTPTAEEQREIAKAFAESEWVPASDAQIPDGESVSMYIYDPQKPMVLTFYMNHLVRVSTDGFTEHGAVYEPPQNAWKAVRKASMHDGESLLKRLTWCGMESLSTPKFWDNFSINPRECDMMTQDGLFFKMSNSIDYISRVSGRVMFASDNDSDLPYVFPLTVSDFQYNLDMGTCYENISQYIGGSIDNMANRRFDKLRFEGEFVYACDGTQVYELVKDKSEYTVKSGGSHRCEFGPPIENDDRHSLVNGADSWNYRSGISYGAYANACLYPEERICGFLYDFDNWEITGEKQATGGRMCSVVKGHLTGDYSRKLNVVDFTVLVDQETGILLEYLGYDAAGKLSEFVMTENLKFGDNADLVQSFDPTGLKKAEHSLPSDVIEQINAAEGTTINPNDTAAKQTTAAGSSKTSASSKTTVSRTTTAVTTTANQNAQTYEEKQKAEMDAILSHITGAPYEDVLHEEIADLYYFGYHWNPNMSNIDTPVSWNERHPIELLRKIDDHRMYGIQKMQQGGLLYTFYDNYGMTHTAWMSKTLSYSDFADIHIGDTDKKVAALEPVTEEWAGRAMATDSLHPVYDGFTQELLLTDGFLEIHYNMEEKPNYAVGDWIITEMIFHPDFKLELDYGMPQLTVYDYSILPGDYPE